MANIPDFTNEAYDDASEFRKELTKVLRDLNKDANTTKRTVIGKNVILDWANDFTTPLPDGYEVANGLGGTFDANTSTIIKIQKVR